MDQRKADLLARINGSAKLTLAEKTLAAEKIEVTPTLVDTWFSASIEELKPLLQSVSSPNDLQENNQKKAIKHFEAIILKFKKTIDRSVFEAVVMNYYDSLERALVLGEYAVLDLYERIYNLPNSSTKQRFLDTNSIQIYDSISSEKPNVFSGVNYQTGKPLVIKYITKREVEIIEKLTQKNVSGLIECYVVKVQSSKHEGPEFALIMPRQIVNVAQLPSVSPSVLLTQGKRIKSALTYIHHLGLVHLDVKLENILVDLNGDWYLCDLDFVCNLGEIIPDMYNSYFPKNIQGHVAVPQIDLYLLGVHLVVDLCCKDDLSVIQGSIGVDHQKVVNVLTNVNSNDSAIEELKAFLFELLQNKYEECPIDCKKCAQIAILK